MKALIFLNGTYLSHASAFYQKQVADLAAGDLVVAADGALAFLLDFKIKPHLVVGDFDSVGRSVLQCFSGVERLTFASQKDRTDGEIALRTCLERGADEIVLIGGIDSRFETDHLLGNIGLLGLAKRLAQECDIDNLRIKMRDPKQDIFLIQDESLELPGQAEDILSIVPLDDGIVVRYEGLKYPLENREVKCGFGETICLRNALTGTKATVHIQGRAILVRHYQ